MNLKKALVTATMAIGMLGTTPDAQSQTLKKEDSSKEITEVLDKKSPHNHQVIEITQPTLTDDGVELTPGRYIKTEGYSSNLYFPEGSDVYFIAKKDVPRRATNQSTHGQISEQEEKISERTLNIPQTIRYVMVPPAWAMRGTSDPNLDSKFDILTDSLSNKSAEIGQSTGPTYGLTQCERFMNLNQIDNTLYEAGNFSQTMQNIQDWKFDNNNNEVWVIYWTSTDFPAGASGTAPRSPGSNTIGSREAVIGIKASGPSNNMETKKDVANHEMVHALGVSFADGNSHKNTPTNLMSAIITTINIHPETRTNSSGNGRQQITDNGPQVSCSVLPVELVSFMGIKNSRGNNQITWTVAQEIDVEGYDIQHSPDGANRETIAKIDAKNTQEKHNYTREDQIHKESSYYRLKMVDQNQSFVYSDIIFIKGAEDLTNARVYPNPTHGEELRIVLDGDTKGTLIKTRVFDTLGNKISEKEVSQSGTLELPQNNGVYFVQIQDANGNIHNQKIIKN